MRYVAALCFLVAGCHFGVDGLGADGPAVPDLSSPDDLAGADLTGVDLSSPDDLTGADLAGLDLTTVDLSTPPDLTGGPVLAGQMQVPPSNTDLTAQGSLDWIEWGFNGVSAVRKSGGTILSDYTVVAGTAMQATTGYPTTFTWSDGTPTASGSTTASVYVNGAGDGFSFTAAAVPTELRTLRVYLGAYKSGTKLVAHLGDGSVADYSSTALTASGNTPAEAVYLIQYRSSAATTLTITFTASGSGGGGSNVVGIAAATVQ